MTEEEAKTKWCPMVRHGYGTEGVGVNRIHQDKTPQDAVCIASKCMMWKWSQIQPRIGDMEIPKTGYCGLAGK